MTTDNDEYGSAFDEFAKKKAAPAEAEVMHDDQEQGDEDEGFQAPADQAGGDDLVTDGDDSSTGAEIDEVSELERLRQENQKWQHRYNSDIGRVNAYQRQVQDLQQKLQSVKTSPDAHAGNNPDGSGYSDDQWAALKEDFPEIAAGIEAQAKRQEQQIEALRQQIEQSVGPIQKQAHESFIQSQYQILEQQHPDWSDVVKQDGFNNWLSMQPPAVRELMGSESAADAAYLLTNYKLASGAEQRQTDETIQKRQRQLRQSQTIPARGARKTTAVPEDDYDAAFDYYASKKAAR